MTKEDNIIVPRWFLEVVENALRIQNNINLDKKTGETCQDRNIKESLNGIRKLLRGEELTGGERLERLQPSLPSNLDDASEEYSRKKAVKYYGNTFYAFKAGAEWMAGQNRKIWNSSITSVPEGNKSQILSFDAEGYFYLNRKAHPDSVEWCFAKELLPIRKKQ